MVFYVLNVFKGQQSVAPLGQVGNWSHDYQVSHPSSFLRMGEILSEISVIFLLIVANGIFSMSEMALVTARRSRLKALAEEGNKRAQIALEISKNPQNFLSTIQVGITLISVLAGALSGATIASYLSRILEAILGAYSFYATSLAFFIVVIVVTYLSLVVGELVPKQIALNYRESIALAMAAPMQFFYRIIKPMAWLLGESSNLILRILRVQQYQEPPITEDEIRFMITEGTKAGVVEEREQNMVENVFNLDDLPVAQLMTHKPDVVWLNVNDSWEENFTKIVESGHSYFPVCQDSLDEVLGVISVKTIFPRYVQRKECSLTEALSEPLFVPENMPASKLLESFKQARRHLALVIDEYGSVQGIITLKDVLEAIVGDLPTLDQKAEPQAIQREDGSWLIDGMLPIEDFEQIFEVDLTEGQENVNYHTVAGFIMSQLEHLPTVGERVEFKNYVFEIVDMDGRRIDKILVRPPA
ncbi:MAG: hemolysin family protein [Leptospiraceae bacterium]|nr:hemolysin family protein [Leptospiraceae bacterium]MDW8305633.1 hemolysin family protein [Leptospiraceae bacterium]